MPASFVMMSSEAVWEQIKVAVLELFELPEDKIQPEARLKEDLEMDSIDAVDLAVRLQDITGEKMRLEHMKNVQTLRDVHVVVLRQLGLQEGGSSFSGS